jgi:hypothetical protein
VLATGKKIRINILPEKMLSATFILRFGESQQEKKKAWKEEKKVFG